MQETLQDFNDLMQKIHNSALSHPIALTGQEWKVTGSILQKIDHVEITSCFRDENYVPFSQLWQAVCEQI